MSRENRNNRQIRLDQTDQSGQTSGNVPAGSFRHRVAEIYGRARGEALAKHRRGTREAHARLTRGTRQAQARQKQVTCEAHAKQPRGTLEATKQTLAEGAFGPLTLHTLAKGGNSGIGAIWP